MIKLLNNSSGLRKSKVSLADWIPYLFKALENADKTLASEIENELVSLGSKALPHLVKALNNTNRTLRAHAGMAMIRIGQESVGYLMAELKSSPEAKWSIEFLIEEIQGPQKPEAQCKSIAS